jgi:Subtilase family/PKD domain
LRYICKPLSVLKTPLFYVFYFSFHPMTYCMYQFDKLRGRLRVALWVLATSAWCSVTMAQTTTTPTPLPVRFVHGTEVFPSNFNVQSRAEVPAADIAAGHYVRYVQFRQVLTTAERLALEATGIRVAGYVHFGAYELVIPQGYDLTALERVGAYSIMAAQPHWKMHRNLRERPLGDWATHGDAVDVIVQVYEHIGIERGAELVRESGMTLLEKGTQNGYLLARVKQADLEAHAARPWVHWMEQIPPPDQKDDLNGRSLHRSNLLDSDHALGRKLDGSGIKVLVRDDGAVGPHIDFQGRLLNQPSADSPFQGTHGDGVAGIIGGAGNLDPTKKGMAAGTDVYVLDYVASFQDETLPLHQNEGVTITNSSYSNGCNDGYTTSAQTVDQQIFNNPTLMHVFSAGNSNGQDCNYGAGTQWGNITGGHKMGKNAIATANLQANAVIDNSSSRGPAHDGRLKPDISAHGAGQNSTDPNNAYQVFGGTSAAAPGIAGCLAQLSQGYQEHYNVTTDAPMALLKLSLLTTANELGDTGPDFIFGWGHVNTWRALRLIEEERHLTASIAQNAVNTHTVTVPAGVQQARLMIYWADPAGSVNAARALVNDLDLRVIGPDGTVHMPWILDPTPDPVALDAPATRGRDSLNNMEQVAISLPTAGTYTLEISGHEVPNGPQAYYAAWDFTTDAIQLTYPAGGEGFAPGSQEWIRWDAPAIAGAPGFTLRYSVDDGANWLPITTTAANARMHQWTVPNVVSGQVRLLLIRDNQRDTTNYALSIVPRPTGLAIDTVCPTYIHAKWTEVRDTLTYDAYLLGEKYMELKTTSTQPSAYIPITNASESQWFSVRASHPNGLAGRRANAIFYEGGLLNCPQPYDAALDALVNLSSGAIRTCGAIATPVVVRVRNEGQNPLSGATVSYRFNNGTIQTEPLPEVAPGTTYDHTFATQLALNFTGQAPFVAWVTQAGEGFFYNDTLARSLNIINQTVSANFSEGFTNAALPIGWTIENPDGAVTWERSDAVTGPTGTSTRTMWVNHYSYSDDEELDMLYMVPLNLTNANNPGLAFSYSHATYPNFFEELRVEAFAGCNLAAPPVVLWEKIDPALGVTSSSAEFTPDNANDWRNEILSLEQFEGQYVVLRFVATNDYGNNTYLDNVGLTTYNPVPPNAQFAFVNDSICRGDTIAISATPSPGTSNQYFWNFGTAAFPATASGIGPHEVYYPSAGLRNVRLIVTNPFGSDTITEPLRVLNNPTGNFTWVASGTNTVAFTNTSNNALSYTWNFGDGSPTSSDLNPIHTYAASGNYTVTLTATNQCRSATKTLQVTATVGTIETIGLEKALVMPNPTQGDFYVEISSTHSAIPLSLRLVDMTGRVVLDKGTIDLPAGTTTIKLDGSQLPAGRYQVQFITERGIAALPVVIE